MSKTTNDTHNRQDVPALITEVEQLRKALKAVNITIGTYLKAYHYPVYEQMAKALEEGEGNECGTS